MAEHSVFPLGKDKTAKEFSEIVDRWLENTMQYLKPLTTDEIKNISVIETIINHRIIQIRDKLIEIRAQMDIPRQTMIPQTKQHLTNLIKELK